MDQKNLPVGIIKRFSDHIVGNGEYNGKTSRSQKIYPHPRSTGT